MSKAGWYPDPGGQAGMFRYWDGSAWSTTITPDPASAPPAGGLGAQAGGFNRGQTMGGGTFGTGSYGPTGAPRGGGTFGPAPSGANPYGYQLPPEQAGGDKRGTIGIVIGAIVLLALIGLIATQAFKAGGPFNRPDRTGGPNDQPTQSVCPKPKQNANPPKHPNDGRVHGGMISYPRLGSPWGSPQTDTRLPFGVDVNEQVVEVEPAYQPSSTWVASIMVAELNAGDGFYAAEEGAQIVAKCVLGAFYGDNKVEREDVTSRAITVDGHEGWLLEMHLSFDIKGLKTKGETATIIVVDTGQTAAALYYSSIPDTTPDLLKTAHDLIPQLRIGP